MSAKTCSGCGDSKPLDAFSRDRSKPDGRATRCKSCKSSASARHYADNAERIKERVRASWRMNRTARTATARKWAQRNPEKMAEYRNKWRSTNRDAERAAYAAWQAERMGSGYFRLTRSVARGVWGALRRGKSGRKWQELVGYSVDDLRSHLEAKFAEGMTWENYGSGWHVDHVRPIASFDFVARGDEAVRECWALSNLQPLWAADNLRKNRWW